MKHIVLATNNPGKIAELSAMLGPVTAKVATLADFDTSEVEETGTTFMENARLKAQGYALQTGLPALADDSGLEIAALGGRPGVHSARYGGADIDFDRRMEMLLDEIKVSATHDRRARFVCAIAIADEAGRIVETAEGICRGTIAESARGASGFGYDPIFIPDGYDLTFGQLSDDIKSEISHRRRAFREIIPFLRHFIAN